MSQKLPSCMVKSTHHNMLLSVDVRSFAGVQVQSILESFIDKSGIRAVINEDGGQTLFETDGFVSDSNVLTMLGYFSLVGLSRLMCLLGRYDDCLRAMAPLNPFNRTFLYTFKVPMANINLYYYSGTAYLMLRRYIDAGRCFNTILSFVYRVKEQQRCATSSRTYIGPCTEYD